MTRYIEFEFQDGLIAKAELLEERAHKTCKLVWNLLPIQGSFHHAMYSGKEVAMILPGYYECKPENSTSALLPWEIFFVSLRATDYYDVDHDFSEIAFFYDRNTGPRMLDGLVKVNIFARFVDHHEQLYDLCNRIRDEGKKLCHIRRASSSNN